MSLEEYTNEFYPEPFPEDVPTIDLKRISLAKLLDDDQEEGRRLFDVCTNEGFCYLDLMSHPKGLKLVHQVHDMCRVGRDAFKTTPMSEKYKFKTRSADVGLLDTGYKEIGLDENGEPNRVELINISQSGLFSGTEPEYELPPWLSPNEAIIRSVMREGNVIHNVILSILEKRLELPTGTLTSLHKLTERSGDFMRFLHYPAPKDGAPVGFPAHRDAVSVALLFCWQGGLQITDSTAAVHHTDDEPDANWYFVRPLPGHVIMNLGDALQILSNGVLKSGKHRVVSPPGAQSRHDRYSVLLSARPQEDTPMRSLRSPVIPAGEQLEDNSLTAKEWGIQNVVKTLYKMRRQNGEELDQPAAAEEPPAQPQVNTVVSARA